MTVKVYNLHNAVMDILSQMAKHCS